MEPAAIGLAAAALASGEIVKALAAGANAVIEWPREKELFAGILAETMGMSLVRGQASRPDVALARTVRAHLRLGPRPGVFEYRPEHADAHARWAGVLDRGIPAPPQLAQKRLTTDNAFDIAHFPANDGPVLNRFA